MEWASFRWILILINVLLFGFIRYITRKMKPVDPSSSSSSTPKRKVLLVIAHPDDESMFFLPTLRELIQTHEIFVLCLSTGNFDGLGETRKREMAKCCDFLQIPSESRLRVVDHPELQDGMKSKWNIQLIRDLVLEEVKKHAIDAVLTFDNHGISGHPNHISVHNGVKLFFHQYQSELPAGFKALQLDSTNLLRKYIGLLDAPFSFNSPYFFVNTDPSVPYKAMQCHWSQFVWFRRLFVIFSRYAYINTLSEM
eukprot:GILI01012512.1.p1 GENE.GILI01012512.1~~GILI01012512.1.p1  ORF type:complete len:271 (-),score=59.78 GILI01012512.1:40-798(-)